MNTHSTDSALVHDGLSCERMDLAYEATSGLLRDTLEALCLQRGISLESGVEPGEPARNYELMIRLGIGHVLGGAPIDGSAGVS